MKNVSDHVRKFPQVIYLACFVQFWIILFNLNIIKLYQNSGAVFALMPVYHYSFQCLFYCIFVGNVATKIL
jgi:hypothetical protein